MSTAQAVIDRARVELNDRSTDARYSDADLLSYLTTAQRSLVRLKPEAYTVAEQFEITTPTPRQRVGCGYFAVLRVEANVDTAVAAPYPLGAAIRTVERDVLDSFYAAWAKTPAAPSANATRYKLAAVDASDPLAFWLFPAPVVGHRVQIVVSKIPPDLTATTDDLSVSDIYIPALTQFVCHCALRSEELGESQENSRKYLDAFQAMLGRTRTSLLRATTAQPRPPEARQ